MIDLLKRVAELQQYYTSKNTPEMAERGNIIRNEIPLALKEYLETFKIHLGEFSYDLGIEGSDGKGLKTEAPWVRLFSKELSPRATTGYYVVIHFSIDGQRCYVTVGCASTKWNTDSGDLIHDSPEELKRKTGWARKVIQDGEGPFHRFKDKIHLGAQKALPKKFEEATVLAELHQINQLDLALFLSSINEALACLKLVYRASSQMSDLPNSEILESEIEKVINPNRMTSGNRQGRGLTSKERKLVENRAMQVTKLHLESLGYSLLDTSAKKPYDFLAVKEDRELKVEVKGTTSSNPDSVSMTSNEVNLHRNEKGNTALSIVSEILLYDRESEPKCKGGVLEFLEGWDIDEWSLAPTSFQVTRKKNLLDHDSADIKRWV